MRAMVLHAQRTPLVLEDLPVPEPGPGQVRVAVEACAVCRTDLHVVDGDLTEPVLPVIPGHQVVGRVDAVGPGVDLQRGMRVGVPWLGWTCGHCRYCAAHEENLCDSARFTGYQLPGGFAEHTVADARFCFPIGEQHDPVQAAPLLCGGLIGFRALRMAGDAKRIGMFGFGSAASMITQVAVAEGREVWAFVRPGDAKAAAFALGLGATWAGGSDEDPGELDAALLFAPDGALVPAALRRVRKGGTVVCAGIHMSDIPSFPYSNLWGERCVRSVANLTREDGLAFLPLAERIGITTHVTGYPLEAANQALDDLRAGRFEGSAVLRT